jgi:glyoxylase-like metal-dependent hydrolase (beta-lactamase superfamily II)
MPQLAKLEAPIPGLYASPPERLGFAPSLRARAFLLRRNTGNLLIYSVSNLPELADVSRWYLNHRHEAGFAAHAVDAPLFVHEDERETVGTRLGVRATFSRRHVLGDDFEVIPTPGHMSGATAYLWDSGQHRFLFTGDTIMLDNGEWVAAVLDSSDRERYLESLGLIRELDFDVLVPWVASADGEYYAVTSRAETTRRVEAIIHRVSRGENR